MKLTLLGTGGPLPDPTRHGSAAVLQIGDARLLLMVGLLIADELSDAYAELAARDGGGVPTYGGPRERDAAQMADEMAVMLESASRRIEAIAARLEQA